jgi:chromosome segregation ATPase
MSRSKVKKELAELEGDLTCLQKRFAELKTKAEQEGVSVSPELQAAFDKLNADVDKLAAQVAAGASQADVVTAVNATDAKVAALLTPTP